MKIVDMTDQHLINAKKYCERLLDQKPDEQIYVGDSEYAEQSVENENSHNEQIATQIDNRLRAINRELKRRGLCNT